METASRMFHQFFNQLVEIATEFNLNLPEINTLELTDLSFQEVAKGDILTGERMYPFGSLAFDGSRLNGIINDSQTIDIRSTESSSIEFYRDYSKEFCAVAHLPPSKIYIPMKIVWFFNDGTRAEQTRNSFNIF